MRILSVDWDYFFPETDQFDWGHRESQFFTESIWGMRAGCTSMVSGKAAIDIMRPRRSYVRFWDNFDMPPDHIIIAESHLSLLQAIQEQDIKDLEVWNFDAHHDLGYGMKEANCGNWALKAVEEGYISSYKLVYPSWRYSHPEAEIPRLPGLDFEHFYEIPDIRGSIDVVFICRSGSWTPTWCDAHWCKFINEFKQYGWLWATKQYAPFALKRRSPNMTEAKKLRKEHLEVFKRLGVQPLTPSSSTT